MSTAELNQKKLDLISWIQQLSDVHLITFLEHIKNLGHNKDWWDELSKNDKKIVLQGLEQAESGDFVSTIDFWQKLKNA